MHTNLYALYVKHTIFVLCFVLLINIKLPAHACILTSIVMESTPCLKSPLC